MAFSQSLVVVVDNTRQRSKPDASKSSKATFLTDRHPIYGGQAEVVRTRQSGDYWHFRMWISDEKKYVRKTLRTKSLDTAIERAEREFLEIKSNLNSGRRIFSAPVREAVDAYISHRETVDVARGAITSGRLGTIKSQLNHFVAYCDMLVTAGQGGVARLNDLESKSLQGYQQYRQTKRAKDVTVRNEQATINAFCKWAFEEGLHTVQQYVFPSISVRGMDPDAVRRGTYTNNEYDRLTAALTKYASLEAAKRDCLDEDALFERELVRHFVLIAANTMMRFGELYQLKWGAVETAVVKDQHLATVTVLAETTKVRQTRVFTAKGGKYFERLRKLSKHKKAGDYVFTKHSGSVISRDAMYRHYAIIMQMAEITDWKERNLTYYSLRHYGITKRLQAKADPLTLSKVCGTSLKHLTETYYHADLAEQEKAALLRYEGENVPLVVLDG